MTLPSTPATMFAWISEAKGLAGLRLAEIAVPRPRPGEVLLRVEAAALNFSDILMVDDAYQVRPPRPFVPGQEVAGTVVAAGPNCGLKPGARIAGKVNWGGFAAYATMRADMAMELPEALSFAEGAAVPVAYTTAAVALGESARLAAGETVLVLAAAGGVGLAAVQIARRRGARVIAACSSGKIALAEAQGVDLAVDYNGPDWSARVRAAAPEGVDVVLDPVGGAFADAALRLLGWQGRYLVVGFASGEIPKLPANRLLMKRASAIGVYWSHDRDGAMLARLQREIMAMFALGETRPPLGAGYPMAALPQALADLAGRRSHGKLILEPSA